MGLGVGTEAGLELSESGLGEDQFVELQKMIGIHPIPGTVLNTHDIAGGEFSIPILLANQEENGLTSQIELVDEGNEFLGLGGCQLDVLEDENVIADESFAQGLAKGEAFDLDVDLFAEIPGLRTMDDATATPQRGGKGASTSATGTLLTPRLFAGAVHITHGFGGSGTATLSCIACNHGIVNRLGSTPILDQLEANFVLAGCGAGRGKNI